MKKILCLLLAVLLLTSQMCVFAQTSYASLIDKVKADESVDMSLIDEDRIIYAEITSYINLDKGINPTSFYLYMPSLDGKDYYTAGFDKNEYVATTKNFVATEPLKYYSVTEAKEFAANNGLPEPTEIKAILTHGRIGLFAYSIACDGKDYIIPYYFTADSTYNITNDNTVRLSLGTSYTIDEFVNISEKEHTLYDQYMNAEKDNKPVISLDENGDEALKADKTISNDETKEHLQNVDVTEDSYAETVMDSEKENFETEHEHTDSSSENQMNDFAQKDKEVVIKDAKECADMLYDFGLFKGTDKGYELEKSLTREESVTLLVRLLGEEDNVNADDFDEVFVDVDKERWSYAYIMYCYKHNITKGTGADTFSPDVQIDANQFITLMLRLLGYTQVNPDTALKKSIEYKLLPEEKIDELTTKKVFTRSDMVQIVYNSLKTQMNDKTVFSDYLSEKGILTPKDIAQMK